MAQLKDLLVQGPSRFIGDMVGTNLQIDKIIAKTSASGTEYGIGTSGQALLSNGTGVYWGTVLPYALNAAVYSGTANHLAVYTASTAIGSLNSNIGGTAKAIYLESGVPKALSASVGSNQKTLVFLNSGTVTASSVDEGSATRPVYLKSGVITQGSYNLYATVNSTATTNGLAYYSGSNVISPLGPGNNQTVLLFSGSPTTPTFQLAFGNFTVNGAVVAATVAGIGRSITLPTIALSSAANSVWGNTIKFVTENTTGYTQLGRYLRFAPTSTSTAQNITIDAGTSSTARTYTFGSAGGEFVTHTAGTAQGGQFNPVYVNSAGTVAAVAYSLNATIGSASANQLAVYTSANAIGGQTLAWETWTAGSTSGPIPRIKVGSVVYTGSAVPSAGAGASGIVTTGSQQFDGEKTFKGSILPQASSTYNLGSTSLYWKNIYANRLNGIASTTDYLSCDTAAGTVAKTVTLADYVLKVGNEIYIIFTNLNTAANPTLNINNTGAKPIMLRGTRVTKQGLRNNFLYHMLYDGTNWVILNEDTSDLCTTTTAAGTAAKTATCPGFVGYTGELIKIKFSNRNTHATPTLNVNGYGNKALLMAKGTTKNEYRLNNDFIYIFRYNGTQFELVSKDIYYYTLRGVSGTAATYYTQEDYDAYVTENGTAPSWNVGDEKTAAVAAVTGIEQIALGNATVSNTTNGMTGRLALYSPNTTYTYVLAQSAPASKSFYLPRYNGDMYAVHAGNNDAVGSYIKPVYVASNGRVMPTSYNLYASINSVSTANGLAYYSGTNAVSGLSVGAASTILFTPTANAKPQWQLAFGGFSVNGVVIAATIAGIGRSITLPTVQLQSAANSVWGGTVKFITETTNGYTQLGRYLRFAPTSTSTAANITIDAGASSTSRTFTFGSSGGEIVVHNAANQTGSPLNPVYINSNGVATPTSFSISAIIGAGTQNHLTYYTSTNAIGALSSDIGSTSRSIYIESGVPKALSASVGSDQKTLVFLNSGTVTVSTANEGASNKPIYLSSGKLTVSTSTIGASNQPIYMTNGAITASSSTIGGHAMPIFMKNGILTPSSAIIGSQTQFIYMSSGSLLPSTTPVGSNTQPVFLNNGSITASSATVGSITQPIFLKSGVITATSYGLSATVHSGVKNRLAYYSGASVISSASTLYADNSSITVGSGVAPSGPAGTIFQVVGNSVMKHIYPEVDLTYDLGSDTYRWNSIYFGDQIILNNKTNDGKSNPGYYLKTNNEITGQLYVSNIGTTSTLGISLLTVGNNIPEGTDNNAQGRVRIYSRSTNYVQIMVQSAADNQTFILPRYMGDGDLYAIHAGNNQAVGSHINPVYVEANGRIAPITGTVGTASKPIFLSSGTITASNSTIGSHTKGIFMNGGVLTAMSGTVGTGTKPIFLSSGTFTASDSTVGTNSTPVYLNAGTITAITPISTANGLLNALGTGSSTPVDADYYISQYVGGGTTTTTYHRRPMSALWSYINGKITSDRQASGTTNYLAYYSSATKIVAASSLASNGIYIGRGGISTSWVKGRDGAMIKSTSIAGYSAIFSIKTKNGSWQIGAYDESSHQDNLIFSYTSDTNYNANTNTAVNIRFYAGGHIYAAGHLYATSALGTGNYGTAAPTTATAQWGNGSLYFQYT